MEEDGCHPAKSQKQKQKTKTEKQKKKTRTDICPRLELGLLLVPKCSNSQ